MHELLITDIHCAALQILHKLAELRNATPLPELRTRHGLRIPPDSECLLNPGVQLPPVPPTAPAQPPADKSETYRDGPSKYNVQERPGTIGMDMKGWAPETAVAQEPPPATGDS